MVKVLLGGLPVLAWLVMTASAQSGWTPPSDADPSAILDEATADTRAGRYADALAKHLWYHEHAVELDSGQYGVRLSFALSYWKELADKYPPALDSMRLVRGVAESRLQSDEPERSDAFHTFHDFSALNEQLEEEAKTLEMFLELDQESPEVAAKVYNVAEPLLVEAKRFDVCGKYLRPDSRLDTLFSGHKIERQLAERQENESMKKRLLSSADRRLGSNAGRLIAILVQVERSEEAEQIASEVRPLLSQPADLAQIEAALEGTPPSSAW